MRYAIIIEKAENNYSAYVPDLPGCVTTGKTLEEIAENMIYIFRMLCFKN
ncbi:MAG: type II toxin-antitoxin system HicB family antitoxin [Microcystis sp. M137S2]|jgi:predicted RNase H-like HicB family nuclease|nr:type II toxin-antitoxin system HicB family antitoxin [Microcystis sp. M087S2]MCA2670442.1 type II toxin-antitoxin system HicB family antitoxin [Microcystis sp. M080S2]MCA2687973.1 type II toxin-antitoxin system HicB family antitoxin [Microcystis sp. M037S2]MCA2736068.1 type II toxin-antitoxin system HicB family antitoxin [Microcystis sp. M158S2]MCA2739220.1 type II toxin-antitoxin system HicB family antitoxin [Microcystis sp. M165S2]MCA2752979.1 type II toxin-antitoxin system HicB family an